MTINDPIQNSHRERDRRTRALCCSFVASLLPKAGHPGAGPREETTADPLASGGRVQQSNGPTDRAVGAEDVDGATPTDGIERFDELVPGDAGRDVDPAIARFHAELRRGLPVEFSFNADDQVIFEPLSTQWVCGPIRVVSYPRRPMARDGLSLSLIHI